LELSRQKIEIIVSCARCNDIAEVAFLELNGVHGSTGPLNLQSPSHGSSPARFVGMSNDCYAPIDKVRKCDLANGCACAQHRYGENILVSDAISWQAAR
jgi:hypothetical protein